MFEKKQVLLVLANVYHYWTHNKLYNPFNESHQIHQRSLSKQRTRSVLIYYAANRVDYWINWRKHVFSLAIAARNSFCSQMRSKALSHGTFKKIPNGLSTISTKSIKLAKKVTQKNYICTKSICVCKNWATNSATV